MATGAYLHVSVAELVLAQLVMLLQDLAQADSIDLRIAPAPLRLDHQVVHLQSETPCWSRTGLLLQWKQSRPRIALHANEKF